MNANTTSPTDTLALLDRLKTELPEIWGKAQVVGKWVWLEFNIPPNGAIRERLKQLGFHWNSQRKCWQHPCGAPSHHAKGDPRQHYGVQTAEELVMNDALPKPYAAKEYKVVALREMPMPEQMKLCDNPQTAADYWRLNIATNPYFDPHRECFAVLLLNTRKRIYGHQLVTIGLLDTLLVHPREVFSVAVAMRAAAIVLMHNHPSGEPTPSDGDIKTTRDLIRAGQLMKIDVLDHVIMGNPRHCSMREIGYFYN